MIDHTPQKKYERNSIFGSDHSRTIVGRRGVTHSVRAELGLAGEDFILCLSIMKSLPLLGYAKQKSGPQRCPSLNPRHL